MDIRRVTVELFRAGPPHNQLLSPLTQYLGVCGDSATSIVSFEYEHASFLRRLHDLSYQTDDEMRRSDAMNQTGRELAKVLRSINGVSGAFAQQELPSLRVDKTGDTLIHFRLVLSASELSMIPFELTKLPEAADQPADNWLAIQNPVPVTITRRVRAVHKRYAGWPKQVRVLFIAADKRELPFEDHLTALQESLQPWRGQGAKWEDSLTVLVNSNIKAVQHEFASKEFTHVHVLAHGDTEDDSDQGSFGINLGGEVVSGESFASALKTLDGDTIRQPTVVTVASCDSGNVGSVVKHGASFAHDLHRHGIPFVVASQFPLDWDASVYMTRSLYEEFFWGGNPLVALYKLRLHLYSRLRSSHDWASLVVYESLPDDLDQELESLRYKQAKAALDTSLNDVDRIVERKGTLSPDIRRELLKRIDRAIAGLPTGNEHESERLGLIASSRKRLAQADFTAASRSTSSEESLLRSCYSFLVDACNQYERATEIAGTPNNYQLAKLHWLLVQMLSLGTILGRKYEARHWETAEFASTSCLRLTDIEEVIWAHASLAELSLLKLVEDDIPRNSAHAPSQKDISRLAQSVLQHIDNLIELSRGQNPFLVQSTLRQFKRYCDWWGNKAFTQWLQENTGLSKKPVDANDQLIAHTLNPESILIETARLVVQKLSRHVGLQAISNVDADEDDRDNDLPDGGSGGDGDSNDGSPAEARQPGDPQASGAPAVAPAKPRTVAQPSARDARDAAVGETSSTGLFNIEMLPARNGDCLWIEYGDPHKPSRMLIDCGAKSAYPILKGRIDALPRDQRNLDLFVLTHIDSDHITGAIPFFNDAEVNVHFGDIWFNGWKHLQLGAKQGEIFSTILTDRRLNWNLCNNGGPIVVRGRKLPRFTLPGGMELTLLSPTAEKLRRLKTVWQRELKKYGLTPGATKEYRRFLRGAPTSSTDLDGLAETPFKGDRGAANGSSIAFLAEYGGRAVLFAADAHSPLLEHSVKRLLDERKQDRLTIDALKLSHHGSKKSLNKGLLKWLDCNRYLVSSNGSYFNHPDREAIARVIKYGGNQPSLYFNYRSEENEVWDREDLKARYSYQAIYPAEHEEGLRVIL